MNTDQLTKNDFLQKISDFETNPEEWVFKGEKPCVVDFYADWCIPCKTVSSIIEELADEYDGRFDVYKVNTDHEQELANAFGIKTIPSLLLCPMEKRPQMAKGAMSKEDFQQAIQDVLFGQ